MGREQLKQFKRLQKENERLTRAVSGLTLDKLILSEAARGNFYAPHVVVPASIRCLARWWCASAGPVVYLASIDPRNGVGQGAEQMKIALWRI